MNTSLRTAIKAALSKSTWSGTAFSLSSLLSGDPWWENCAPAQRCGFSSSLCRNRASLGLTAIPRLAYPQQYRVAPPAPPSGIPVNAKGEPSDVSLRDASLEQLLQEIHKRMPVVN
jgi:hypothetical protein